MAQSWLTSLGKIGLAAVCVLAAPHYARAEIALDKLTACADLQQLYDSLSSARPAECARPKDALSRQIMQRAHAEQHDACILKNTPAEFLEGFTCVRLDTRDGREVTCFRTAEKSDVDTYKAEFGHSYSKRATHYGQQAARCAVTNGDVAPAQRTLMPGLLVRSAKFEFGFIAGIGRSRRPKSAAIHGFATLDPDLGKRMDSEAIEFVDVYRLSRVLSAGRDREVTTGNWVIGIDEGSEFDDMWNKQNRNHAIRLRIDSLFVTLLRHDSPDETEAEKLAFLEAVQDTLADYLDEEGLKELDGSALEDAMGMSKPEMIEQISRQQPYGWQGNVGVTIAPFFRVFYATTHPRCTQDDRGTVADYLMAMAPTPRVQSDYGELGVMLAGIDRCASRRSTSTVRYIQSLQEELIEEVTRTLSNSAGESP